MSAEWYVGQQVNHFRHGRGAPDGPFVVEKVGRTLVHIRIRGRLLAFRMDSGRSNTDFGGRIERPEDTAKREAHRAARERLAATGVILDYRSRKFDTVQLNELAALVEGWDK